MFEVGFTELLLIFAIALVVLGPQRLPKLAQQVGRWIGRARAMARQFREQLEEEAANIESKMNVDPGIDTSLTPKPPATTATPAIEAPPAPAEAEQEFYPPDHHMHASQRPAAADAPPVTDAGGEHGTGEGAQSELDLTTSTPQDGRKAS